MVQESAPGLLWYQDKSGEGRKSMLRAYALFVLAGLAEIGGGYLVWQWLRHGRSLLLGLLGGIILFLYGIIATRQEFASFGKVYAAYGGVFIVLAVLWGWGIDHRRPDLSEWIGAAICLVGVTVMLWKR
jgi:small multidrug resistance family-3 protein